MDVPNSILARFDCSETDSGRWTALTLKDAQENYSTGLRIAKYMPDGVLLFSIGATEFGRTLGLDAKIRAIISEHVVKVIEVKSTNGVNLYPGFNFHELTNQSASQILDSVIAAVLAGTGSLTRPPTSSFLVIEWEAGDERIEIDIANLTEKSKIRQTVQHIDGEDEDWTYETTSRIRRLDDGRFEIEIHYDPRLNSHIPQAESWWGTTTLVLNTVQTSGNVQWIDDNFPQNNIDQASFKVVRATAVNFLRSEDELDQLEIEGRLELGSTDRELLIKARRGQGLFRAKVLKIEKFCRVTGTASPIHLRASHIKPWAASLDNERLDGSNGLMLAPHIDHLFDRAYISFDDEGRLLVLNVEVLALLRNWGIDINDPKLAPRPFSERQCFYLQVHRQRFEALKTRK